MKNDRGHGPLATAPTRIALAENTAGCDFAVADIHGYFSLLEQQLAARKFDPACDRVIAVGDLIDRGPESARALEFLARPWFHSVRGNHEQAMLEWLQPLLAGNQDSVRENAARHVAFGGDWIAPLLTRAKNGDHEEIRRWHDALAALPIAISVPRKGELIGVIHATVPGGDWSLMDSDEPVASPPSIHARTAMWARKPLADVLPAGAAKATMPSTDKSIAAFAAPAEPRVTGIDRVYVGHNVVDFVQKIGNLHMIEIGAWLGHGLTVINLDDDAPRTKRSFLQGLLNR